MITIGIIGTRRRDTKEDFEKTVQVFGQIWIPGDQICSGLCPQGGDWFAVLLALDKEWIEDPKERERLYQQVRNQKDLHYAIKPIWYPADWKKYGRAAGPIRNTDIAKTSNVLIACVAEDRLGGTEDTIKKFRQIHPGGDVRLV
jgi:hypothetical protein